MDNNFILHIKIPVLELYDNTMYPYSWIRQS